jgi:hypothetical protein
VSGNTRNLKGADPYVSDLTHNPQYIIHLSHWGVGVDTLILGQPLYIVGIFNMFTEKSPTSKRSVGGRGSSMSHSGDIIIGEGGTLYDFEVF